MKMKLARSLELSRWGIASGGWCRRRVECEAGVEISGTELVVAFGAWSQGAMVRAAAVWGGPSESMSGGRCPLGVSFYV